MNVDVCVVCYNSEATLPALASSVAENLPPGVRLLLWSNSATKRLTTVADALSTDFGLTVEVLGDGSNLGFARACNRLAQASDREWLLFLNPDAAVRSWPEQFDVPEGALVGPVVYLPDGRQQETFGPDRTISYEIRQRLLRRKVHPVVPAAMVNVDFVSGAAILVRRRDFLSLQGFDETFFMYYEDIDLGRRWRGSGRPVVVEPRWTVTHIGGASAKSKPLEALVRSQRSAEQFHEKWTKARLPFRMITLAEAFIKLCIALPLGRVGQIDRETQYKFFCRILRSRDGGAQMVSATSDARPLRTVEVVDEPRLKIFRACGYLLFFLMLFVPTRYQPVKLGLLLICLISIISAKSTIRIQRSFLRATVLISSFGALEILYGTIRGNVGAYPQLTVWVIWPLVFLLLSSAIYTERHLRSLFRTMVFASNAIGVYGCLYMLTLTGRIPSGFYFNGIDQGQGLFFEGNVLRMSLYSFSSLLFLVPFLVALAIMWPREMRPVTRSYWIYLGIVLNVALVVLSGRRALLLVFILIPILLVASILATTPFKRIVATRVTRARLARFVMPSLVVGAAAIVAVAALHIDLVATFTSLTTGYKAAGDEARRVQFQSLIDGWSDNPIFGAGLGAVAEGPIRSIETPWAYELSYVALLFDIGVVGVLIYAVVIGNIIRRAALVARAKPELRPWTIPVLVGMASFLIANVTNPYLLKFDSMWVLFLPVALLNVYAVKQERESQPTEEHPSD